MISVNEMNSGASFYFASHFAKESCIEWACSTYAQATAGIDIFIETVHVEIVTVTGYAIFMAPRYSRKNARYMLPD